MNIKTEVKFVRMRIYSRVGLMNIFCIVSIHNDSRELPLSNVFASLKKKKKEN